MSNAHAAAPLDLPNASIDLNALNDAALKGGDAAVAEMLTPGGETALLVLPASATAAMEAETLAAAAVAEIAAATVEAPAEVAAPKDKRRATPDADA